MKRLSNFTLESEVSQMYKAIVCEDMQNTAQRICLKLKSEIKDLEAEDVSYRSETGSIRNTQEVAKEVSGKINDLSAILVDLIPHFDSNDRSYGFKVIKELAAEIFPGDTTPKFLKDPNIFTVIITVDPGEHKNPKENLDNVLMKTWGITEKEVELKHIRSDSDIKYIIDNRSKEFLLPVIEKTTKEAFIPRLVNSWLKSKS